MRYEEAPPKKKRTENWLKAAMFKNPEWIPCSIGSLPATGLKYGKELEKIFLNHKKIFPDYREGSMEPENIRKNMPPDYRLQPVVDSWGCTWKTIQEGIVGEVVNNPLSDWSEFSTYKVPDPIKEDIWGGTIDINHLKDDYKKRKQEGYLTGAGLYHGFFYMRLYYLRGFENLMMDIGYDDPRLKELEEVVCLHSLKILRAYIDAGVEAIFAGEDLGTQKALPMSPVSWRKHIKPYYERIFGLSKNAGCINYLHSDGYILDIIDDLVECGINVINPQFRPNTLKGLSGFKGKICMNLDMDRQLFPFATQSQLKDHFKAAIDTLALPEGGLMLGVELGPDLSLKTIDMLCDIAEEFTGPGLD